MQHRTPTKSVATSFTAQVRALNLVPVRYVLAVNQGWTLARVRRAEAGYRKFLERIAQRPQRPQMPSADVDEFWHAHILCTQLYTADCQRLFGRYLHHAPFFGRA